MVSVVSSYIQMYVHNMHMCLCSTKYVQKCIHRDACTDTAHVATQLFMRYVRMYVVT